MTATACPVCGQPALVEPDADLTGELVPTCTLCQEDRT